MKFCSDSRPRGATSPWFREMLAACVTCVLMVVWAGASSTVRAQADAGAQANQLHAAIANGDVESLKYWLSTRHANPAAANAAEPGVTPIERCLGLAARVLDAGSAAERRPGNSADAPVVSLRVLQEMVTLLGEHGARLTDADRQRFSGPVVRWYRRRSAGAHISAAGNDRYGVTPAVATAFFPTRRRPVRRDEAIGNAAAGQRADREPCEYRNAPRRHHDEFARAVQRRRPHRIPRESHTAICCSQGDDAR